MKKITVFLCFLAGAGCFISAGLYINKQNAGLVTEPVVNEQKYNGSPVLLSEVNMNAYVSLPASFSTVDIEEDIEAAEITEDNVEDVMYEKLFSTAEHIATVSQNGSEMLIVDYTITKDSEVQEVNYDYKLGFDSNSKLYDTTVYNSLKNAVIGDTVHVEEVEFLDYDNVTVDIIITDILAMPYPVTDKYISSKTEYSSVYDMKTTLVNDASGEVKKNARQYTIDNLINIMMDQTTFIKLPESLIMKELEVLQKDDKDATYDDAKHSLYKIFFISSVIKEYDVASKTDIEKRFDKLDESTKDMLSEYETERMKYLLFEEDVVTCIYKKIQTTE